MKGIVFTEFLDMVEDEFGMEVTDDMIDASALSTNGAYTSVGTYDHSELLQMVTHLSEVTGSPMHDLVCAYGYHLFTVFSNGHSHLFGDASCSFDLLEKVEHHIHVEVRKLYPDAELPTFICERRGSDQFIMEYRSTRPFASLAEGLIRGCIEYFGESIELDRQDIANDGTHSVFSLSKSSV